MNGESDTDENVGSNGPPTEGARDHKWMQVTKEGGYNEGEEGIFLWESITEVLGW